MSKIIHMLISEFLRGWHRGVVRREREALFERGSL